MSGEVTSELYIGTSGYSYKDWVGPVYPPGTSSRDYLRHFSRMFSFTELNFSYYRMPVPAQIARIHAVAAAENPGFRFAVKAHRSMTHDRPSQATELRARVDEFRAGVMPLAEAGSLAAVLLQFPFSFHYTDDNRWYLDHVCSAIEGLPLVVEFRNSEWVRDSVRQGLSARGIGMAAVDEPRLPGLLSPEAGLLPLEADPPAADSGAPDAAASTPAPDRPDGPTGAPGSNAAASTAGPAVPAHSISRIGYVRFHGRNAENWWSGDNVSRYDYSYTDAELSEWIPRIRTLQSSSRIVLVAFNNHAAGKACANARRMQELLGVDG